jgi:hypothetical protein
MDRWEFCYVDLLRHGVTHLTAEGWAQKKIKKNKGMSEDTKDDATARFVAVMELERWEPVSGNGEIRPILYFRRRIT